MDITLIDALVSLAIAYLFLLPGFNQWPREEFSQFSGKPKNYISSARYFLFGTTYVFSFLVFAYALRQLGLLATLLDQVPASEIATTPDSPFLFLDLLRKAFGDNTLPIATALIVGGVKVVPQLKHLDDKWRGYLLTLARVPKDALDLKQLILAGLQHQLPQGKRMETLVNQLKNRDPFNYWLDFDTRNPGFGSANELKVLILKNLYLAQVNRSFDLIASDSQDLIAAEELVGNISSLLPPLDLDANPEIFFQYKNQLDKNLKMLAEMLACNAVKAHSKRTAQLAKMKYLGLEMDYMDQHDLKLDILKPGVTIVMGLLVVNLVVISLGLILFDALKIAPPSHMDTWFELTRALRWSLGSWISLTVALFFGCFFHETLTKHSQSAAPLAYFLAFFFATLGSGLYFLASRANFSSSHIWLSISFGLMALVAMKSGVTDSFSSRETLKKSQQISLVYGGAVAVLQILIIITLQGMEAISARDASVWFAFGFAKGYFAAFVVTHTLLDYHTRKSFEGRRKSPRIPYHKRITGQLNNAQTEILVKNISYGGALVRFPEGQMPATGQALVLDFDFSPVPGVIVWAEDSLARLRFDATAPGLAQLKTRLQDSVGADYLLVMAA
jgi:hypothetical protein